MIRRSDDGVIRTLRMSVSVCCLAMLVSACGGGDDSSTPSSSSSSSSSSVTDTVAPTLSLPADLSVSASAATGTPVTWTATANDAVSGNVTVTCSPASGDAFPVGATTVNCSATDAAGNTANGSFTVTVTDSVAPVLSVPANRTVSATSASGAAVTYTATATDEISGTVTPVCSPASGSVFSIGKNTVNCTATDASGNVATGSFVVTVPAFQIELGGNGPTNGHTCAALPSGQARCWGYNGLGQIGNGTRTTPQLSPTAVLTAAAGAELTDIASIEAGANSTCAVMKDSTARCWGQGSSGRLGHGASPSYSTTPVTVVESAAAGAALSGIASISMSNEGAFACALMVDGTVRCWGAGVSGQLGNNANATSSIPVVVLDSATSAALTNVVSLSVGASHACGLISNGTVRCWGGNGNGELGFGTVTTTSGSDSVTPNSVSTASTSVTNADGGELTEVVAITAGTSFTCAALKDGTVRCWGKNDAGQLGIGTMDVDSNGGVLQVAHVHAVPVISDVTTSSALTGVSTLEAGTAHVCALIESGSVQCWGSRVAGSLGDGGALGAGTAADNAAVPVTVTGITDAVTINVSGYSACAITDGGTVGRCWGRDQYGQLGDGAVNTSGTSTPVVISGL